MGPTNTIHHAPYDDIDPKSPELSVSGKVVLITGGGTGIGSATVAAFATAGAKHVIIAGRRMEPLEEVANKV